MRKYRFRKRIPFRGSRRYQWLWEFPKAYRDEYIAEMRRLNFRHNLYKLIKRNQRGKKMKGNMRIIHEDGYVVEFAELSATPPLDLLQRAVGGYLELVPRFTTFEGRPCIAYCNEDGKLNGLPVNHLATGLWIKAMNGLDPQDVLVGPVVVLTGDETFMEGL